MIGVMIIDFSLNVITDWWIEIDGVKLQHN